MMDAEERVIELITDHVFSTWPKLLWWISPRFYKSETNQPPREWLREYAATHRLALDATPSMEAFLETLNPDDKQSAREFIKHSGVENSERKVRRILAYRELHAALEMKLRFAWRETIIADIHSAFWKSKQRPAVPELIEAEVREFIESQKRKAEEREKAREEARQQSLIAASQKQQQQQQSKKDPNRQYYCGKCGYMRRQLGTWDDLANNRGHKCDKEFILKTVAQKRARHRSVKRNASSSNDRE